MDAIFQSLEKAFDAAPHKTMLIAIGALTATRFLLLGVYQTGLNPDEAQYWFWSRDFAFGYYSKPPMIAWVIGAITALFGDTVWAVRAMSPVLIGGAGYSLFVTGRWLYGDKIGVWAAVIWLLYPAVMLGATIFTTDVPLLFFWSAALMFLVMLAEAAPGRGRWAGVGLGAAIGLGFLSKYAMVYFPLGWGLALMVSPYARKTLRAGPLVLAFGGAGLIFAPNLWWNVENGLQTLSHTADNADWSGTLFNPEEMLQFFGDQFGVAGPFLFAALLIGVVGMPFRSRLEPARDRFLLCFILPPLVIILAQSLLSRAHANWAMAAYPAAAILLPVWMIRWRRAWVLWLSVTLHSAVGIIFTAALIDPPIADTVGLSNAIKRVRGWDVQAEDLLQRAEGFDGVVVDEREVAAHLVWEWRRVDRPIAVADINGRRDNTYEFALPFVPEPGKRYLLIKPWQERLCWYGRFDVTPLAPSFVDLHATRRGQPERTLNLYALSAYRSDDPDPCATDGDR